MSVWMKVPASVVAKVSELLTNSSTMAGKNGFPVDLPRELVTGLITYLDGYSGCCAHRTGVCNCDANEAAYMLRLALKGEQVCPRCDGEGMVEYQDHGMATCPRCFTSGICPIEEEAEVVR